VDQDRPFALGWAPCRLIDNASMETVEVLLDAAEARIRRDGYNAVSFRDLAADAQIKSASVHYHFPRKEDLGVALVERYSERFFGAVAERAIKAKTPRDRVSAFCDVYRSALRVDEAICLCGMLGAESPGLPPPLSEAVAAFFAANVAWLQEALDPAWSKKRREAFALTTLAALQGAMMIATSMKDPRAFEQVVESVLASVDV
jgi:TetR/AcrR family transcriptional regulator, transcriptional repressor for nem operon